MTFPARAVRGFLAFFLVLLAVASGLVVGAVVDDAPARAATMGAGIRGITPYGGYLGNYVAPDGSRVYCMDSPRAWPSGSTGAGAVTSTIRTTSGHLLTDAELQRINWVLSTYGQTTDPIQAAAVAAVVYAYTSTRAQTHGAGHAAGAHYIGGNDTVRGVYDQIFAEAQSRSTPVASGSGSIDITMANPWDGYVTITTSPVTARGTLTLTGAVDVSTGKATVQVGNGSVVVIRSSPGDETTSHRVAAKAQFTASSGATPTVTVFETGSQQRTLRGGHPSTITFEANDETDELDLRFAPVVRTAVVSEFVSPGERFVDGVTAAVVPGSTEWRRRSDGSYLPVVANGTLFGPFTERPDASPMPPADAPIVGRETITLNGPGTVSSPGSLAAPTAGFYTWVWSITATAQSEPVRAHLPDGYSFADEFGLLAETHIVPIDLMAVSAVTESEIGLGGTVSDDLTVSLETGSWLTIDGEPVPATFEGTAYFLPGDAAPVISDAPPADAIVLGTASITATGPGTYRASSGVTAPAATPGFISWVWQLSPASPTAAWFLPWTDSFGLPHETTRVSAPTVITRAMPGSAIGDPAHDTAIVGGIVPVPAAHLVFEAYLQNSDVPVCDDSTRVFDSAADPIAVSAPGEYTSPPHEFSEYGTYFWVETLHASTGEVLHRGECGAAGETTLVAPGEVSTVAVSSARPGEPVHDTARVEGLIPRGSSLTFDLYRQVSDDGARCDPSTRVFTSSAVPVRGAGHYDSPPVVLDDLGTYHWVETLRDRHGDPLHIGVCGAPSERTTISNALADTGASVAQPLVIATVLLGAGILAVLAANRTGVARTSLPLGNKSRHRALPLP